MFQLVFFPFSWELYVHNGRYRGRNMQQHVLVLFCCILPYTVSCRYSDWLRTGQSGDRIPVEARFSAPVQTGPGAHPASCTMGTGSFPGVKSGRGVTLTSHPFLVPWSWMSRAIPLPPLWAVRPVQSLNACTRVHFTVSCGGFIVKGNTEGTHTVTMYCEIMNTTSPRLSFFFFVCAHEVCHLVKRPTDGPYYCSILLRSI
jgi:hypothetical protein